MIKVIITPEQQQKAKELYDFLCLNNSIMHGKSNIFGALGEILVQDLFIEHKVDTNSTYDYDLIIDGLKIDVKTKKITEKFTPQPDYFVTLPAFNTKQKCDYYFFTSVSDTHKYFYLLGYISKENFFKNALFKKKNEKDIFGFPLRCDCYTMQIKNLHKFSEKNIKI